MIPRPDKCAPCGSYQCDVPMPIRGRVRYIDLCVAPVVAALNAANIETVASCCGHGVRDPDILLADGTVLVWRRWDTEAQTTTPFFGDQRAGAPEEGA